MTIDLQICDANSIASFDWPEEARPYRATLTRLASSPSQHYFGNCNTQFLICRHGEHLLPMTVNDCEPDNSYVCSPYCGIVRYPLVELRALKSPILQSCLRGLICAIAPILRWSHIDRTACVNNWLLSTNLYPRWNGERLRQLTSELTERYPQHAILFRSVNNATNGPLCDAFRRENYLLAPSRQVYLFQDTDANYLRRQNCRWDSRLLTESSPYEMVLPHQLSSRDDARIKELYDMLYLEKYTPLNPQFTVPLIALWRETAMLRMFGLRSPSGTLDGIVGLFERDGSLTAPLVGYDTSLPQELGLYRMLMAIVLRETANGRMTLNLSSGAAGFKRLRGGKACIEYTSVYCNHLPLHRRATWRAVTGLLTRIGAPVLRKFEL